jgi:hypothetical protein
LYDGDRLTAEYNGASATPLRRYVHGPGVDEPLVWYEGAGATDRRYLIADHQGSIIAENGASTTRYSYGPYGEPNSWPGPRFRYTGQIALPEVGLYYPSGLGRREACGATRSRLSPPLPRRERRHSSPKHVRAAPCVQAESASRKIFSGRSQAATRKSKWGHTGKWGHTPIFLLDRRSMEPSSPALTLSQFQPDRQHAALQL